MAKQEATPRNLIVHKQTARSERPVKNLANRAKYWTLCSPLKSTPEKKGKRAKKDRQKRKKRTRCVQNRARRARKASADNLPVARYHQLSTPLVSIFTFRIEVQTRLKEKSFRSSGKFFRFSYNFRLALTAQLLKISA